MTSLSLLAGRTVPILLTGKHTEVVKHLVLAGAILDAKTRAGLTPSDLVAYDSEIWSVINDALKGDMPDIDEIPDVPDVPDYALPDGAKPKKGKKGKKGKGKKGKGGKKGKKKAGAKKGKKKKKK